MIANDNTQRLIVDANVTEYFWSEVSTAVANQRIEATEETLYYLVNLLTSFTDARALFDQTPDGLVLKPLATLYAEAVAAPSDEDRNQALKRLGDIALFISGVFSDSLNRKPVDVDYYIAMGGNAYDYLSDAVKRTRRWRTLTAVFNELASKFILFVDVLGEVSERAHCNNDSDIMRLYEVWLRTGSQRAKRRLQELGIQPITGSRQQH